MTNATASGSVQIYSRRSLGSRPPCQIRPELLHSRAWHRDCVKAKKTHAQCAQEAGCCVNAIAYWRGKLGLVGQLGTSRLSRRARRTYANKSWFFRARKAHRGPLGMLQMPELQGVSLHTLKLWQIRHQQAMVRGPQRKLPVLLCRLLTRKWLTPRVWCGRSDAEITAQINRVLAQHGITWFCYQDQVEQARRKFGLPTVAGVAAWQSLELRGEFGKWLGEHPQVWNCLTGRQRQVLALWYIKKPLLRSGAAIARRLHCSTQNTNAVRVSAIHRLARRGIRIPQRFHGVTLRLRRKLV